MSFEDILNTVRANLVHCHEMSADISYLAAVSGGPDSVLLLYILKELRSSAEFEGKMKLKAAHFNHGLRGASSDADEAFVRDICHEWKIDLVTGKVKEVPANLSGSSETWAREMRHRFLQSEREKLGEDSWILLGHHADDRFETILINLGRGSGSSGLAAMPVFDPRSHINRPLLNISRQDIMTMMGELGLSYRHDHSNDDISTWRNRLRIEVIPVLKDMFGNGILERVGRTADIIYSEDVYLSDQTEHFYRKEVKCIYGSDTELLYQLIECSDLAAYPTALRRRLLHLIISRCKGVSTDVSFQLVDSLDQLLLKDAKDCAAGPCTSLLSSGEITHDLPFAIRLVRSAGSWRIYRKPVLDAYNGPLTVPVKCGRDNGYGDSLIFLYNLEDSLYTDMRMNLRRYFSENIVSRDMEEAGTYGASSLFVDTLCLHTLVLRNRRTGDRLPVRRGQELFHKRVKQFLQERGVWPELRDRLLLFDFEGETVWIPGLFSVNSLNSVNIGLNEQDKLTELRFM